jgi:hypothetical protein
MPYNKSHGVPGQRFGICTSLLCAEEHRETNTIELNEPKRSARVGYSRIQKPLLLVETGIASDPRLKGDVVEKIREAIDGTACWGDVEGIGMSVREALANAVIHGSRCDPEKRSWSAL